MKKILLFASALAGLFLAGCQRENLEPQQMAGTVKFTVEAPGAMSTKATIADGTNVNEVHYEVYKNVTDVAHALLEPTSTPMAKGVVEMSNKKANINFDLLQDQEYTVIFWAQVKDAGHYNTENLRCIELAQNHQVDANDETRAAFYARYDFDTYEHKDHKVTLRRPFAQLNLLTTLESLEPKQPGQTTGYKIDAKTSEVKITGLAVSFNTITGVGNGVDYPFTFNKAATPEEKGQATLAVEGTDYHYVAMNYMFVPVNAEDGAATVNLDYEIVTDKGAIKHSIVNVPIRENYRTNVIGNLFTKESKFEIIVDAEFDGEYYGPEFMKTPAYDEDTKTWTVAEYYEFVWFVDQINNKKNDFEGETIRLATDIDLENKPWTPLGATGTVFKGTFDGAKLTKGADDCHTISNLNVAVEGRASAGLFATSRGVIKNLKVVGATVTGHYKTGVILGDGLCGKVENCHVENATVVVTPYDKDDANNVGGIVGYLSAEPTAYVKNCSVKNSNITAYRKVGGIVGAANRGAEVSGNTIEESTITADQTSEYKEVKPADLGAVIGCKVTNNIIDKDNKSTGVTLKHKVNSVEELNNAADDAFVTLGAGVYDLTDDVTVDGKAIQITEGEVVINSQDNTVTAGSDTDYGFIVKGAESSLELNNTNIKANGGAIAAVNGATVTVNDGSVAVEASTTNPRYNIYTEGAGSKVIINDGTFSFTASTLKRAYVYASAGTTVEIKGGTFGKPSTRSGYKAGIRGDGTVIITGGTFGFDPSEWLAEGYTVKKEGQNWVVVGPAENTEDFLAALSYAKPGDVIYVAKSVVLPSSFVTSTPGALTIEGVSEDAQVSFNTKAGGADGGLNCYADGMDLVFKNIKVVSPNTGSAYSGGFGRVKSVLFDNCEYYGQYRSLSYVKFDKCTIDPQTSYIYTDYSNADFVNCVFNCSEGKGIQVYNDGNSTETTINVTECTFEAAKHGATWDGKPVTAIDINSNGEKFTVNITKTTATGFPVGLTTGYSLFNIKGGAEYVTVYVDGSKYIAEGLMEDAEGNQVASTEAGLKEALENGGTVVLANPFTIDQSESNGYGKTGINMTNGGTLDGNGNELGAPGSTGTWDSAINTSGGTIKNIKITKGFRGIFIKNEKHNEKLYLDNVTIEGTTYTISCDQGNGLGLEATNSTFKGWTSYAGTLGNAKFTDCYFGYGNGYSYCRPYAPTEFVGCEFEAGLRLDPRAAVTFENCTLAGVALSADNISTLVTDTSKVTIK